MFSHSQVKCIIQIVDKQTEPIVNTGLQTFPAETIFRIIENTPAIENRTPTESKLIIALMDPDQSQSHAVLVAIAKQLDPERLDGFRQKFVSRSFDQVVPNIRYRDDSGEVRALDNEIGVPFRDALLEEMRRNSSFTATNLGNHANALGLLSRMLIINRILPAPSLEGIREIIRQYQLSANT